MQERRNNISTKLSFWRGSKWLLEINTRHNLLAPQHFYSGQLFKSKLIPALNVGFTLNYLIQKYNQWFICFQANYAIKCIIDVLINESSCWKKLSKRYISLFSKYLTCKFFNKIDTYCIFGSYRCIPHCHNYCICQL